MTALDWGFIAAYFVVVVVVGLRFAKRGGQNLETYFAAGRKAPWWLVGAGMIATTFAADTPLVVTGLVAAHGVAGNWLWWSMAMSGVLTVFLTARLWRRAGVLSDVELIEVRYGGAPARFLRGFRALFLALPVNLIILGWVHLAMIKVLKVTFGLDPVAAMVVCFAVTVVYSSAAGLLAVMWTDAVQLVIMMIAVIALAVFAVDAVGGLDAMLQKTSVHFGSLEAATSVLPPVDSPWMPLLALVTYLSVQWWAAWYPGSEPGGGGYVAQRIFAARSEKDGVLAALFFNVGHYALRPWPWIVTALCTVILYPGGVVIDGKHDLEAGYAQAIVDLLPPGWRGFLLAGFAAAYMSTVSTHLNWGSSYLVNDIYKRFIAPEASDKVLVRASRAATVFIFLLSLVVTTQLDTVAGAWQLLIAIGSGTGAVLILRWFWWRISAASELAAMVGSVVLSVIAWRLFAHDLGPGDAGFGPAELTKQAQVLLFVVGGSTITWLVATFATKPESDAVLRGFAERVRPGGPGWAAFYARSGMTPPPRRAHVVVGGFVFGTALVYLSVAGIGHLSLGRTGSGVALVVAAVGCLVVCARLIDRDPDLTPAPPRDGPT